MGRYRNTDPVLTNYLIRLALDKKKEPYHAFPQKALFDKIGVGTRLEGCRNALKKAAAAAVEQPNE